MSGVGTPTTNDSEIEEKLTEFKILPFNPRPMLQSLVGKEVIVRLKWGQAEYHGNLVSIDSYMNVQLSGTEEYMDGKAAGVLGQVLIRCNNVLWICAENQNNGDTAMTE